MPLLAVHYSLHKCLPCLQFVGISATLICQICVCSSSGILVYGWLLQLIIFRLWIGCPSVCTLFAKLRSVKERFAQDIFRFSLGQKILVSPSMFVSGNLVLKLESSLGVSIRFHLQMKLSTVAYCGVRCSAETFCWHLRLLPLVNSIAQMFWYCWCEPSHLHSSSWKPCNLRSDSAYGELTTSLNGCKPCHLLPDNKLIHRLWTVEALWTFDLISSLLTASPT